VYFAREQSDDKTLLQYEPDEARFVPTAWPEDMLAVRARVSPALQTVGGLADPKAVYEIGLSPIVTDVPALVVPVRGPMPAVAAPGRAVTTGRVGPEETIAPLPTMRLEFRSNGDALILVLDDIYLRETMLRTLAERHFPQQSAERYRVLIVDRHGAPVLTRNLRQSETIARADADIAEPFFGLPITALSAGPSLSTGHIMAWNVMRADGGTTTEVAAGSASPNQDVSVFINQVDRRLPGGTASVTETRVAGTAVRLARDGWELRLQHAAGSLDAAVANARSRNLWLSFGMLTLLMMSVGLIVLNAQRSERLAARQMDFVATVSHELRTPLAVIRSAAQNLQAGVVLDREQASRYGDLIEDEGRRLTDMVEQVLEFAGLSGNRQALRARPVEIRSLVNDVVDGCQSLLDGSDFEVARSLPADLPMVTADDEALRRAIQNLIANAVKYAAEGRWLGVSAEAGAARGRHEVRINISDRGRGIEPEDLPHIFEPFYRGRYAVDRQIHGNGLGLSLVKRIAETHGGRLTVTSQPGQGATFTIHLPALAGETAPAPMPHTAPDAGGRSA
jgi:signal transduction histidine kinase